MVKLPLSPRLPIPARLHAAPHSRGLPSERLPAPFPSFHSKQPESYPIIVPTTAKLSSLCKINPFPSPPRPSLLLKVFGSLVRLLSMLKTFRASRIIVCYVGLEFPFGMGFFPFFSFFVFLVFRFRFSFGRDLEESRMWMMGWDGRKVNEEWFRGDLRSGSSGAMYRWTLNPPFRFSFTF